MSDPKSVPVEDAPRESPVTDEIGRAVASIWQRRAGVRPNAVRTEAEGDVVRCVIEEGTPTAEEKEAAEASTMGSTDSNAYRTEATHAVAKVTKRSVSAFMSKRDKKTGVLTQTFCLERSRVRY
jgi:hypothetical protein